MRWTPNQPRAALRALGPAGIGDLRPIRGLCPARVGADDALPVWEPVEGGRVLAAVAGVGPAASQSSDRGSATRRAALVLEALGQQAAELAALEMPRGLFPLSLTGALGEDPDPREVPTDWSEVTLAGALLDTQVDRLRLWWVGDARVYYLDSVSLYRLSYDDMPGPDTRVSGSGPVFWTRTVDVRPASPGLLFVCTPGAHGPFAAPWLLEQALIGAFQRADTWKSWISLVNKAITHQASAGASFSAVPWGAGSYDAVRDTILGPGGNRLCDLAVMQSAMGGAAWLKAWLTLYGPVQERWRWSLTAPIATDGEAEAYATDRRADELRAALQVVSDVQAPADGGTPDAAESGMKDAEFDDGPFRPTAWAGVADALHRLAEEWGRAAEGGPPKPPPEPEPEAPAPDVRPLTERVAGAAADLSALAALAALSNRGPKRSADETSAPAPEVDVAAPDSLPDETFELPDENSESDIEVTVELEVPVIAPIDDEAPVLGSVVEAGPPPDLPDDPEPVSAAPPADDPLEVEPPEVEPPEVEAPEVDSQEAPTTVAALVAEVTKDVPAMPDPGPIVEAEPLSQVARPREPAPRQAGSSRPPPAVAGQPLRSPSMPQGFLPAFLLLVVVALLVLLAVKPWDRQSFPQVGWPSLSEAPSVHSLPSAPRLVRSSAGEDQIPRAGRERIALAATADGVVLAIRGSSEPARRSRSALDVTVSTPRVVRSSESETTSRGVRSTIARTAPTYVSARGVESGGDGPARRHSLATRTESYASPRAPLGSTRRTELSPEVEARSLKPVVPLADMRMRSNVYMVLRHGPSMATRKVWVIPPGGEVAVLGRKAGTHWIRVRFGRRVGWSAAVKRFLVPVQDFDLDDIPTIAP